MTAPAFVHLRLHSEFSIADGTLRIDEAIDAAAQDGMPALALTDLSNVFGLVKFYRAARERGVKPIAGCDVWLTHESERDAPYRLLLLCASRAGYLKLCDWLSRTAGRHSFRAASISRCSVPVAATTMPSSMRPSARRARRVCRWSPRIRC